MAEHIYTDVTFSEQQEIRARKLMRIVLWVVAIVGLGWTVAIVFFIHGDSAAAIIDFTIAMLALT